MNKPKYPLYLLVIASTATLTASEKDKEAYELLGNKWGAMTANQYKQAAENANEAVKTAATALSPEVLGKSGSALTTGLLAGADDKVLADKADLLGSRLGEAAGAGLVFGAYGAVKSGLVAAPGAAKAAVIGAVTSPVAIPVLAGAAATGFTGYMGYVGWVCHRENQFNRCLSRHFDNTNLNDRGYPRRCESPERRLRYWTNSVTETYIERFKAMKRKGKRPESYWLGSQGIEDQKD